MFEVKIYLIITKSWSDRAHDTPNKAREWKQARKTRHIQLEDEEYVSVQIEDGVLFFLAVCDALTATFWSLTIGATCAPVSSSSAGAFSSSLSLCVALHCSPLLPTLWGVCVEQSLGGVSHRQGKVGYSHINGNKMLWLLQLTKTNLK